MLQLSGHGGADPPAVTFTAVNISDAVAVDNPHNADSAVIVLR